MRGVLDHIAQYERQIIRGRIRAAIDVKRRRGERIGSVPFGFKLEQKPEDQPDIIVPDDEEQATIARILQLRAKGGTYRSIAAELNRIGERCRGRTWYAMTVQRIVNRNNPQEIPSLGT